MRRLRFGLNVILLLAPIIFLGIGAVRLVRGVFDYLNSGRRLAGTMSAEATRALGREIRVGDVKITGNLWSMDAANRVDLIDVYVANGPTPASGALARARRVSVWYNLRQVLADDRPLIPLVDEIQVDTPVILLQRSETGQWNYQDLIRRPTTAVRSFTNKVSFTNASLLYADRAFPHPEGVTQRPLDTRLDKLHGVVLVRADKSLAFDITGAAQPAYAGDFHVIGTVLPRPLRVQAHVTAARLVLPALVERLAPPAQLQLRAGLANVDLGILYTPPDGTPPQRLDMKTLTAHGTVQIFDAAATGKLVYAPVEHLNGLASFTTDSVLGNLTADYAGLPVRIDGSILGLTLPSPGGSQHLMRPPSPPVVSVRGSVLRGDWQRISRLTFVPPLLKRLNPGVKKDLLNARLRGDVQFQAAGPADDPELGLSGVFTEVEYAGVRAANVDVRGLYSDQILHASVRGRYAGGDAVLRGNVAIGSTGVFEAQAQGRGIDIARLGVPLGATVTGRGRLDLSIRGQNNRTPNITAQADLLNASVNGQTVQHAYVRADTAGPSLVVRSFVAEDKKGFVVASGTVGLKSRKLDLQVDADELNFGAIARAIVPPEARPTVKPLAANPSVNGALGRLADVEGFGYARTRLTGTMDDPTLQGKLYAFGIRTGALDLDKVTLSDFSVSRKEVRLQGVASRYPGQIQVGGAILLPFSRAPALNIDARVEDLDLTTLLEMAGVEHKDLAVTGSITSDKIAVRGTLASPQTPELFTVNLQNASLNGVPIRNAALTMRYQAEGLYVQNASAQVAEGLVVGTGWLPFDGPLHFAIHGGGIALQPIEEAAYTNANPDQAPPLISGSLAFDALVTGTLKEPVVTAQSITANDLVYNGFQIGSLRATGDYARRRVRMDTFVLNGPVRTGTDQNIADPHDGVIAVNGLTYNLDTKQIRTEPGHPVQIEAIPLERLRLLAEDIVDINNDDAHRLLSELRSATGPISATVALGGTIEDPEADVTWKAAHLRAKNYELTSVSGSALINKTRIIYPSPQTPELRFKVKSPYADITSPADPDTKNIVLEFDHDGKRGEIRTIPAGAVADLRVDNITLDFLQNIIGKAFAKKIEGTGNIYVVAHGRTTTPILDLSSNLDHVVVEPVKGPPLSLDRVYLEQTTIEQGAITVGRLSATRVDPVTKESFAASATAKLTGFSYQAPFLASGAKATITANVPVPFIAEAVPGLLRKTSAGGIVIQADLGNLNDDREKWTASGKVDLNVPRLELASTSTGLQDLNATVRLLGDRLTVDNFAAHTYIYGNGKSKNVVRVDDPKRRGSDIQMTGSLPLGLRNGQSNGPNDGITIRILDSSDTAQGGTASKQAKLTFDEEPLPNSRSGVLRGTLRSDPNRPLRIRGSVMDPILTGRVTLFNALITPANQDAPGNVPLPILPRFDLALQLGSNVRIRTPQLDARLSTDRDIVAHGNLLQGDNDIGLEGTIQISDGKLKLPTASFVILPGASLHVKYPTFEGTDPVLGLNVDLRARGTVVATSMSGVRKRYQVTVTAKGPLTGDSGNRTTGQSNLALNFETSPNDLASSPALLKERLAGAIVGVNSLEEAGRNPGQAFANVLSGVFTGSLLPGLFDRTAESLGFEELAIGYDPIDRLTLSISRNLFGPIYVSYYRTLTATQQRYDLKFSYRFRDRYQLSFDLDEQHTQKLLLEGVWKF